MAAVTRLDFGADDGRAARVPPVVAGAFSPGALGRHKWVERHVRHSTWYALPFFIETMRWFKESRHLVHQLSTSPATRSGLAIPFSVLCLFAWSGPVISTPWLFAVAATFA
jgi:hypothetical protein